MGTSRLANSKRPPPMVVAPGPPTAGMAGGDTDSGRPETPPPTKRADATGIPSGSRNTDPGNNPGRPPHSKRRTDRRTSPNRRVPGRPPTVPTINGRRRRQTIRHPRRDNGCGRPTRTGVRHNPGGAANTDPDRSGPQTSPPPMANRRPPRPTPTSGDLRDSNLPNNPHDINPAQVAPPKGGEPERLGRAPLTATTPNPGYACAHASRRGPRHPRGQAAAGVAAGTGGHSGNGVRGTDR
jgi:hypothetical protein